MVLSLWTEKEEEIFNPQKAFMKYFSTKPLIKIQRDNEEPGVKELYLIVSTALAEVKAYVRKNPDALAEDAKNAITVRKITSELIKKIS